MLKSKNCDGEGKFKLIKHFARNPRLKVNDVAYIKLYIAMQCSPAVIVYNL